MGIKISMAVLICLIISGASVSPQSEGQKGYMEHEIENPLNKKFTIEFKKDYYNRQIDSLDNVIDDLKKKINYAITLKSKSKKEKRQLEKPEKKWIFFNVKPEVAKVKLPVDTLLIDSVFVPPLPQPLVKESFIKRLFHHKKN